MEDTHAIDCRWPGPLTCHFCKSDFGHLWPTAQNLDILGPTIQQLKLSSQCHQYVVLHFFVWMWFCVSFFEEYILHFNPNSPSYFGEEPSWICPNPTPCTNTITQLLDLAGIGTPGPMQSIPGWATQYRFYQNTIYPAVGDWMVWGGQG